jgi:ADP-ribosylglycohydrolase/protein-tyrosine phosphatase
MRTSLSHPLRIDTVSAGAGCIGMTFSPGKKGPSVFGDSWDRDLEADLAVIAAWSPTVVVTLIEAEEFTILQTPRLGEAFRAAGLEWRHLPIRDLNAPDPRFERAWTFAGAELRDLLSRGGRVLVHCRGGRGRTGLVACRLLTELGEPAEAALRRVRAAREGAVETKPQIEHVLAVQPVPEDPERTSRRLACLAAGAVGDALGYAVEFLRMPDITRRFGDAGILEPQTDTSGRLVVSDDTQMTLFAAQGLIEAADTTLEARTAAQRKAFLDWLETQEGVFRPGRQGLLAHPSLWVRRAPGNTCLSALRAGGRGDLVRPINDSKGCGGVMRAAPAGLLPGITPQAAFDLGVRGAALTHGHPSGYLPAGVLAALVAHLMVGDGLDASWGEVRRLLARQEGAEETLEVLDRAVDLSGRERISDAEAIRRLGEGWTGHEALAIALFAALRGEDLVDTLRIAANHDGDSDSTAAIAGNLRGAEEGLFGLPLEWILALDVIEPLIEINRHWPTA